MIFPLLQPSPKVEPQGRSDIDAFLDMDGIVGKTMQSGSMTWSEMQLMSPMKPACGRSAKERRPRYKNVNKVNLTLWPRFVDVVSERIMSTSTVTATETATATDTVTFSVAVITFFSLSKKKS